jgi:flagellar biosynthetic protein FliP
MMGILRRALLCLFVIVGVSATSFAEPGPVEPVSEAAAGIAPIYGPPAMGAADELPGGEEGGGRMATAIEIAILLTLLSILPAILITVTSFTRIVIVLSFVRRALSVNELPPNPVLIGLALFLTTFVMAPVAKRVYEQAWEPYRDGALEVSDAGELAWSELAGFLVANTRESELELFAELAGIEAPVSAEGEEPDGQSSFNNVDLPLQVVVPAFVLSEIKTAFQMGFLLFLPFLVIDLVIASILLSMGMFMLPPVMISTPFKILIFVLVDGWHLVCESLVTSFITP